MSRFVPALTLAAALCGCGAPEVSFNQGAKRRLTNVAPGESSLPLVAGRDGLLEVLYGGAPATATLDPGDGREPLSGEGAFRIPGDRVGAAESWTLRLSTGQELKLDVGPVAPRNALKVTLVPFSYEADGSHRLPDLGAAALERYRARLLGMYPVSNVEVSVHAALPWPTAIEPGGGGWRELGFELFKLRQADAVPDDVYYFGVVDPAATLEAYCAGSCLVGLTVWNDEPPEGKVELRLALGVGFPEVAADSAAHELGHSHGLHHAPCGSALDSASIDLRFPYADGGIGVTGYDVTTGALIPADSATDIMGYCEQRWISDYHFARLLDRGGQVNGALLAERPARVEHDVISVDGAGRARLEPVPVSWAPIAGRRVVVRLEGEASQHLETEGRWLSFDHLPGGWVLVPRPPWRAVRAELR